MADDANVESLFCCSWPGKLCLRLNRLIDHTCFGSELITQLFQRLRLQYDDALRQRERLFRPSINVEITINVCSRECDHDRRVRTVLPKPLHRCVTATRVQRNQHVAAWSSERLPDRNTMTEFFENARPTNCGDAIAMSRSGRSRRDDRDLHYRAQVRKPSQTSRRSGV